MEQNNPSGQDDGPWRADVTGAGAGPTPGMPALVLLLLSLAAVATGQDRRHQLYRLAAAGDAGEVARILPFVRALDRPVGDEGRAVLHAAVESGSVEVMSLLLAAGANPDVVMEHGWTPLHLATEASANELAAMLLTAGADVEVAGELGLRALHLAAERGQVGLVGALLNQGADPLARSRLGWTALHLAVAQGQQEVVELLARDPKSVAAATRQGWTPLHLAAAFDRADAARVLLAAGAKTDVRNVVGRTPGLVALRFGSTSVAPLLPAAFDDQPRLEVDPKPAGNSPALPRFTLWLNMGYPGGTIPPHGLRVAYWQDGVAIVAPAAPGLDLRVVRLDEASAAAFEHEIDATGLLRLPKISATVMHSGSWRLSLDGAPTAWMNWSPGGLIGDRGLISKRPARRHLARAWHLIRPTLEELQACEGVALDRMPKAFRGRTRGEKYEPWRRRYR